VLWLIVMVATACGDAAATQSAASVVTVVIETRAPRRIRRVRRLHIGFAMVSSFRRLA
jgi:hypothetical protein